VTQLPRGHEQYFQRQAPMIIRMREGPLTEVTPQQHDLLQSDGNELGVEEDPECEEEETGEERDGGIDDEYGGIETLRFDRFSIVVFDGLEILYPVCVFSKISQRSCSIQSSGRWLISSIYMTVNYWIR